MVSIAQECKQLFYWQSETPEAWSRKWREKLSADERALVEKWDKKWLSRLSRKEEGHGPKKSF